MIRFCCLFVLAGVFQVINSQGPPNFPPGGRPRFEDIPEKCRGPPPGVENPEQCCQIEPIYTKEELASCGVKERGEDDFQERRGPPDCSIAICLLRTKGLLTERDSINFKAVAEFLENYAAGGNMKPAVDMANAICVQEDNVPGPPQICEHMRIVHCIGGVLFGNCAEENWVQSDNCKALKDHMNECKRPFQ